jgi:hypothetical protein
LSEMQSTRYKARIRHRKSEITRGIVVVIIRRTQWTHPDFSENFDTKPQETLVDIVNLLQNILELDRLPTDQVVRYKNKPDLQSLHTQKKLFNEP